MLNRPNPAAIQMKNLLLVNFEADNAHKTGINPDNSINGILAAQNSVEWKTIIPRAAINPGKGIQYEKAGVEIACGFER